MHKKKPGCHSSTDKLLSYINRWHCWTEEFYPYTIRYPILNCNRPYHTIGGKKIPALIFEQDKKKKKSDFGLQV